MRILIVDDRALGARKLCDDIQTQEPEYQVEMVFTKEGMSAADRALQLVRDSKEQFDVFLIDDNMGAGMNGSELMQQLRYLSPGSEAIIFTAYADDAGKQRAIEGGARAYVPRPVNEKELLWQLRGIQRDQRARKERDWLKLLAETTEEMQQATTIQAVGDAIVQGVKQLGFQRARLRVVSNGTGEQLELIGLSEIGASPSDKEYKTIKRSLQDLPYSRKVLLDTKRPTLFHGRELGAALWDEYVMPPKDEWFKTPLFMGEKPIGTLSLDNGAEPRKYTDEEQTQLVQLLELFGKQAATALERARLYQQTDEQAKEARVLSAIGRRIMTKATNGKLDDLLDEVRQQVGSLMDVSNFMVVLSDLETDALDFRRHYEETDPEGKPQDRHWRASDEGLSGYVITHNEPILTRDTDAFRTHHHLKLYGRRAECWLGVPLRLDPAKAFGALIIQSYQKKDFYTAEQQLLLGKIADQIAGAIYAAYEREREEEKRRQEDAARQLRVMMPRLIEESEDGFWHAVLTTITHKEGNSFNRALLFLQSPTSDGMWIGRMAVGHWTREDARRAWERDRDDNNKTLQDYFAAPYRAFSNPTPLQQKVLQWRLTPEQVEMLSLSERKTTTSSKLEGALPERELLRPPDLLDGATDYDCALLPIKQNGKVIGVLWVDNAFDGEPLRGGDLDKVEELLAQAVEVWQQAQERNQTRLLGEKYEDILALNRRINERAAARSLKESLQDLCDQSIHSIISASSVVIYPYLAETGAYDLENVVHCGLDKGDDFILKNKPRQQGVTFSVLQSGPLVVPDVDRSNLRFSGKRLAEHSFIQREAIKAVMAVPMRKALTAEPLGVIYFDYRTAKKFTEQDIARAEHLATIGATAISYARDFGEEKHGREQAEQEARRWRLVMQLVANIQTQALASDVDEEKLTRSILLSTAQMFEFPVKITLAVLDWQGEGDPRKTMRRDYQLTRRRQMRAQLVEINSGVIGQVLEQNKLLHHDHNDLIAVLRTDDKPIGALAVQHSGRKSSFNAVDAESLQRVGRASELAWDSVRTRKDLQTMTETIGAVSASTDLAATLDAIVTYARQVAPELDCVTMWYTDAEDKSKLIPGPQWNVRNEKHRDSRTSDRLVKAVMKRVKPLFAPVVERAPILQGDFTKDEQIASTAALPLRFGEKSEPLGALFLNYRKHHVFSTTEQALFTAFAAAAATAIHNAQTLELAKQRQERFETALKVATAAGASLDLDTVLRGTCKVLQDEFRRKDTTATPYIMLYDDRDDVLELPEVAREFYHRIKPEYADRVRLPLNGEGITCDVARRSLKEKKVIVENAQNVRHKKYQGVYVEVNSDTKSELCAGLVSEDRLLGALVIKSDKLGAFNEEDEKLFEMAAKQVASVLDHTEQTNLLLTSKKRQTVMAWQSEIAHAMKEIPSVLRRFLDWLDVLGIDTPGSNEWGNILSKQVKDLERMIEARIPTKTSILANEMAKEIQDWLDDKNWNNIFLDIKLPEQLTTIYCDHRLLRRSIQNLIINSAEAMKYSGIIQLIFREATEFKRIEIEVSDEGPGIPDSEWLKIKQGGYSTKAVNRGYGLFISGIFMEIIDGDIQRLPSLPDVGGARFLLWIPTTGSQ